MLGLRAGNGEYVDMAVKEDEVLLLLLELESGEEEVDGLEDLVELLEMGEAENKFEAELVMSAGERLNEGLEELDFEDEPDSTKEVELSDGEELEKVREIYSDRVVSGPGDDGVELPAEFILVVLETGT